MTKKYFDIIFSYTAPTQGFVRLEANNEESALLILKDALKHLDITIEKIEESDYISPPETDEDQDSLDLLPPNLIN